MFSEGNGRPSSTRALSAFVVLALVGTWTSVSWRKNELQKMDPEHVALVVGVLGVKVWQRGKENDAAGPTEFLKK